MRLTSTKIVQYLILAVPSLFLFLFFIIPMIKIFSLAFNVNLFEKTVISFDNILSVLSHPLNRYFLRWDLEQAFLTTILCILVGLPGSYIFAHYQFPLKGIIRSLLTVPFILPPIVVLIGFIEAYGHGGWVNQIWEDLTGNLLIEIYNTYEGILLAHMFYNIPVIIRLTEIGWKSIDPELIAVAKSLKGSKWQIFRKIQLPQLLPILATAAILVFIYAFNSFAIVLVLGGVYFQTLEVRIYSLAKTSPNLDYSSAAALTLVQIFINIIVIALYLIISRKYEVPTTQVSYSIEKPVFSLPLNVKSMIRTFLILCYFFIVSLICILPLIGVFTASFTNRDGTLGISNYSRLLDLNLRNYIGLPPQDMIFYSLFFGICVMILASFLSLLLNQGIYYETTYKGKSRLTLFQTFSGIIVILPLTVSSITMAFSIFSIYHTTPLYENIAFAIIIAQTLIAFPFANRVISSTWANFDPTIVNVARSLGSSRLKTFLKVELPILLPTIIVAGLFSFAISIGEFGATTFLARATFATMPVGIYRLISTRNIGVAAAFSAILIIITSISFMLIEKLGRLDLRF